MIKNRLNIIWFTEEQEQAAQMAADLESLKPGLSVNIVHLHETEKLLQQLEESLPEAILVNVDSASGMGKLRTISQVVESAVPIVVISPTEEENIALTALQFGAQDYVLKEQIAADSLLRSLRHAQEIHQLNGKLQKKSSQQQHLLFYDQLTDLPNRQLFFDRLFQALASAKRSGTLLAIMYLDINNFKLINDAIGHRAGDMILKNVASRLQCCIRESDTVARMGSDEFAFIINDISDEKDIIRIAQKVLSNVAQPIILSGNKDSVSACLGISVFPADADDAEILVRNAELAHQRAKLNAANSFQFFNSGLDKKAVERIELEQDLRFALTNDELEVYYQPQFDIQQNRLIAFEALLRWWHPRRGAISPSVFIPIAEESGLIIEIGKYVLQAACNRMQHWHEEGFADLCIAVNLSPRQFRDESLHDLIQNVLQKSQLPARYLELEITESNAMDNIDNTINILSRFREMDVRLSLDDFGTGYSSLSYLRRLPIDTLKIDRSFIHGIPENNQDCSITTAIIALAKIMELQVVAEGVERREQLEFLKQHGCDIVQGFYFSKPVSARAAEKLIRQQL